MKDDSADDSHQITRPGVLANRWVGLVAASSGLFLGSLDITVNVALPEITRDFAIDVSTVQWIIVFYVGSTTGLQLGLGSAADTYGLKRFYLIGLAVYTAAVLLVGITPLFNMVLGLRMLQAVGNGLILASVPAIITSLFPPSERGKALGFMTAIATLGVITGALGGGILIDSFSWRAIFLARVPLGAFALLFAWLAINPTPTKEQGKFDLAGAISLFVGLASFVLFMALGGRTSWLTPETVALLLVSVFALTTFALIEGKSSNPILDITLLKNRVLLLAASSAFLMFMATFVNLFILPFYVSDTLGVDAKVLGFLLMLTPGIGALSSSIGGWLSDRIRSAYLSTFALAVVSLSLYSFTTLNVNSSITDVALRMALVGLGFGIFQASNANLVMGSVTSERLGTGGAAMSLSRSMGTVTSVSLISAFFAARMNLHDTSLLKSGLFLETAREQAAFVAAFGDTYLLAAALTALAALISIACWPRVVARRFRPYR